MRRTGRPEATLSGSRENLSRLSFRKSESQGKTGEQDFHVAVDMNSSLTRLSGWLRSRAGRRRAEWFLPLFGLLLAQGSPFGLCLLSYLVGGPAFPGWILAYVWIGTSIAFAGFGHLVGRLVAVVVRQLNELEEASQLQVKLKKGQRDLLDGVAGAARLPISVTLEYFDIVSRDDPSSREVLSQLSSELKCLDARIRNLYDRFAEIQVVKK